VYLCRSIKYEDVGKRRTVEEGASIINPPRKHSNQSSLTIDVQVLSLDKSVVVKIVSKGFCKGQVDRSVCVVRRAPADVDLVTEGLRIDVRSSFVKDEKGILLIGSAMNMILRATGSSIDESWVAKAFRRNRNVHMCMLPASHPAVRC
jgi:hypothetical protein